MGDQSFLWNNESPDWGRVADLIRDALIAEYAMYRTKMDLKVRLRFPKENTNG